MFKPKELTKDDQLAFLETSLRQAESNIKAFEPEYEEAQESMVRAKNELKFLQSKRDHIKAIISSVAKS